MRDFLQINSIYLECVFKNKKAWNTKTKLSTSERIIQF